MSFSFLIFVAAWFALNVWPFVVGIFNKCLWSFILIQLHLYFLLVHHGTTRTIPISYFVFTLVSLVSILEAPLTSYHSRYFFCLSLHNQNMSKNSTKSSRPKLWKINLVVLFSFVVKYTCLFFWVYSKFNGQSILSFIQSISFYFRVYDTWFIFIFYFFYSFCFWRFFCQVNSNDFCEIGWSLPFQFDDPPAKTIGFCSDQFFLIDSLLGGSMSDWREGVFCISFLFPFLSLNLLDAPD